jgi:hypothetical protein
MSGSGRNSTKEAFGSVTVGPYPQCTDAGTPERRLPVASSWFLRSRHTTLPFAIL